LLNDDVTVLMPFHDRLEYLRHYIREGFWDDVPIQVVCDGSPPSVLEDLYRTVGDRPGIRVHAYPENLGVGHARAVGLRVIPSRWTVFCDDDDFMHDVPAFRDEARAALRTEDQILFYAMPYVHAFTETLQHALQYDRRAFQGKTGLDVLTHLVHTGEMQVLTLGSVFRTRDLQDIAPEPFFKVSEDYVLLARLCAKYPFRRVRLSNRGRYMRLRSTDSLSARSQYSLDKLLMHLVSMFVGAFYLIRLDRLTVPAFREILARRGEVLQKAYGRGRDAALLMSDLLRGVAYKQPTEEQRYTMAFLDAHRPQLPDEFRELLHLENAKPFAQSHSL
jgi:hypothetical protein